MAKQWRKRLRERRQSYLARRGAARWFRGAQRLAVEDPYLP